MRRLFFLFTLVACTNPPPPCAAPGLRATPARLLTRFELDNTARDLVGDTTRPGQALPAEPLALGLDNNSDVHRVTADFQARLLEVAEGIAARAIAERKSELVTCTTPDVECGGRFIDDLGRRAFRRPLTAEERDVFVTLFASALAGDGFDAALEQTLTAVLLSPQFLYRLEPFTKEGATESVDAHALASRLSYFLWGSMPDDALLGSAESGALGKDVELERQTKRLLQDARAQDPPAHLFSLLLQLDAVLGLEKDRAVYPAFDVRLRPSWKTSAELFAADVFAREHTLKALLTSNALFVDENLGALYGSGAVPAGGFERITRDERAGLLTQPGFLARLSSPDQSSPVRRGVFVLENVMCQSVPPPPPSVMAVPPPPDASSTTRERFAVHESTQGCSGCHQSFDGLGFGFEHFDGIGAYRTQDNGKPVDATGQVEGAAFDGAPELMQRLAGSREVHDCAASQWTRLALGRVETGADACGITAAQDAFFKGGGDFDVLRLAIVKSPSFREHAP